MMFSFWSTLFVFALLPLASAVAAPELSVDHPTYNFGTILQGKKIEHVFTVKNNGNEPLHIKQVKPACGCTAANISSPTILPGKKAEIKASFNSTNFYGAVSKSIAVESNDPKAPSYNLSLTGTIIEEIEVNPKQLNFGRMPIGAPKTLTFAIDNRSDKPLKLGNPKASTPQATLKTGKMVVNAGESVTISVTVTAKETDRVVSGYVSLTTDASAKPVISVPFYGSPAK